MTQDELVLYLNGREIGKEIDTATELQAKESGLVVVFGASDDLMECRGAVDEEIGACNGGMAYLDKGYLLESQCEDDYCPYFEQLKKQAKTIEVLWCDEPDICWTFKTEIPHETFNIMEDGEVFCRGIVFRVWDI